MRSKATGFLDRIAESAASAGAVVGVEHDTMARLLTLARFTADLAAEGCSGPCLVLVPCPACRARAIASAVKS